MRSARVPTSSTDWHHAACPMQMKWLSNFSALSTPLRTNLPARLKQSFLCSSLTFVLPRAAWGWEQSPRLLWAHGSPVPLGLSPMPQPCTNGTSCIPGAPGAGLAWWCPGAPVPSLGLSTPIPRALQCRGAAQPGRDHHHRPAPCSDGCLLAGRCPWMQLQAALHTSAGY